MQGEPLRGEQWSFSRISHVRSIVYAVLNNVFFFCPHQFLSTRGYNKTLLMEAVLQRYLASELAERKKIHEEEMKELSK